ncbi:MAG: hypothetical protein QXI91_05330 [Candidatus Bathyarchaeia archaeon]
MMKKAVNISIWKCCVISIFLGIFIVGSGFLIYFALILPSIINSSWYIHLLVIETIILPLLCCYLYLMYRFFFVNIEEKTFPKKFWQWIAVFVLVYCYSLSLVFFAFIFEEFVPFLPMFYKGILLPAIINLILILLFTRTRLWFLLERIIKYLFRESSDK